MAAPPPPLPHSRFAAVQTGATMTNYTSAKLSTNKKRSFLWSGTYNNSQPIVVEARMRLHTAVAKGMW